jgi:hypothetical protein
MKKHNLPVCAAFCGRPVIEEGRTCANCRHLEELRKKAVVTDVYDSILKTIDPATRGALLRQWGEEYAPELVKLLTTGEIPERKIEKL